MKWWRRRPAKGVLMRAYGGDVLYFDGRTKRGRRGAKKAISEGRSVLVRDPDDER